MSLPDGLHCKALQLGDCGRAEVFATARLGRQTLQCTLLFARLFIRCSDKVLHSC